MIIGFVTLKEGYYWIPILSPLTLAIIGMIRATSKISRIMGVILVIGIGAMGVHDLYRFLGH